MAQTGIPGIAVGLVGVGALLVYAGLRGLSPLEALREVSKNEPHNVSNAGVRQALDTSVGSVVSATDTGGGGVVTASDGSVPKGAHPEIADAAMAFRGDRYSQAKRSQSGYSDCSSFVAKSMRQAGISVPDYTTTAFMRWGQLKQIPKSQIARGDLLINPTHMAIALSPTTAIGQQNGHRNVATGSLDDIMMYTGPWSAYRYVGSRVASV